MKTENKTEQNELNYRYQSDNTYKVVQKNCLLYYYKNDVLMAIRSFSDIGRMKESDK